MDNRNPNNSCSSLRGIFMFLKSFLSSKSAENTIKALRDALYDHIQNCLMDSMLKLIQEIWCKDVPQTSRPSDAFLASNLWKYQAPFHDILCFICNVKTKY